MTQPPNGQGPQPREVRATEARTDLYGELGLDRRKTSAGLYQDLDTILRQNPNDPRRQQLIDAQAVLGSVRKRRRYDELIGSDGRVAVSEVRDLAQRPESAVPLTKSSSWTSPGMITGYAIFGLLIVAVIIFGAVSCGEDGEPAADRGAGPVSTAADGETYTLSDVVDGEAELETVRTIDLAAVVPDAASFAESAQTAEYLARGADGTLTVAWVPKSDSYNVVRLDVSGETVKVVEQKSLSRTAWYDAANAAKADGTRSRNIRGAGEMSEAVELADGRIFAFAKGYGGKIYELKAVAT